MLRSILNSNPNELGVITDETQGEVLFLRKVSHFLWGWGMKLPTPKYDPPTYSKWAFHPSRRCPNFYSNILSHRKKTKHIIINNKVIDNAYTNQMLNLRKRLISIGIKFENERSFFNASYFQQISLTVDYINILPVSMARPTLSRMTGHSFHKVLLNQGSNKEIWCNGWKQKKGQEKKINH